MSNYIDSIQLSGTVYTIQGSGGGGGTVESAITSGSTNAVESKAIYDATHIDSFDLWTATDSNSYSDNTQSLYKVYVQYTGDTALDEQVQVEIYYGSNFTREAISGNVYQETATTSSVFTSTFDNGKWIIESSSPNYISNIYADYRFKIWAFNKTISDNFAADSIKDDIIPYISDVDTIARNAVTGGNLMRGDSNKELRLFLQKGNGGSTSSVMQLDDLKCSNGTLSTDIQIPTGEIGWTEITPQNNCIAGNMPTNKVKVIYSGQTVSANYRRLQFNAVFATNGNTYYSVNINWSNTTTPTVNGCSAVTATYDSTDDSVTIELPTGETTYDGSTGTFSIENLRNNYCQFGTGISSVKCYGDITEDIYTAMAHKQDTLSAGTGIEISGNVISATGGGGGNPTVELTQAEYDALVSAGTVSADTYYIITDATAFDPTTKVDTSAFTAYSAATNTALNNKVNTSAVVSSVTSASTDSEIPTAKAVWEAASGGGTTYTAGRGIDITNDTISFNLPISAGTGSDSLKIAGGQGASAQRSIAIGVNSQAKGIQSIAIGESTANGEISFAQGTSYAQKWMSSAFGQQNYSKNNFEASFGNFNNSVSASTTFGDSGNTLFSIGNGTSNSARHNAFEIRQNGDIYLSSGGTDIKLQDYLGGGSITVSSAITSGDTNAVAGGAVYDKFNEVETVTARALNEANEVVARALNDLNDRITALENQSNNS